jgi:hypothetical protein
VLSALLTLIIPFKRRNIYDGLHGFNVLALAITEKIEDFFFQAFGDQVVNF